MATAEGLRTLVGELEPRCLTGEDAARLLSLFAEIERLGSVGKALMARRVEETSLHKRHGHRSASDYLAATTKISPAEAQRTLEATRRLEDLPEAAQAWRKGKLSQSQANEIAAAAVVDPSVESELVAVATSKPLAELADRCRKVRATASDEKARYRAIHRSRYLRHWTGSDGAFRMDLRTTPDAGAAIVAGLGPFKEQVFADARCSGRRERSDAYAADALVAMARCAHPVTSEATEPAAPEHDRASRPRRAAASVAIRVDAEALERGHVEGGETCEIPGIGSVPVATAVSLLGDATVKLLLTRGVDVVSVLHLSRTVTAHQRSALEQRDPTCVVEGCRVRSHLEIDHIDGWALTRVTTLDRLARLCAWHHHQKTFDGFRLEGGPGHWEWCAPVEAGGSGDGEAPVAVPADVGPAPPGRRSGLSSSNRVGIARLLD